MTNERYWYRCSKLNLKKNSHFRRLLAWIARGFNVFLLCLLFYKPLLWGLANGSHRPIPWTYLSDFHIAFKCFTFEHRLRKTLQTNNECMSPGCNSIVSGLSVPKKTLRQETKLDGDWARFWCWHILWLKSIVTDHMSDNLKENIFPSLIFQKSFTTCCRTKVIALVNRKRKTIQMNQS